MDARRIAAGSIDGLLDLDGAVWRGAAMEQVALMGTPLGMQPTGAIRAAWAQKTIGAVSRVDVAAVHDGQHVAFRLEWDDANEDRTLGDTTTFSDAAAVLLAVAGDPEMVSMGAQGSPVNAWYWRADEPPGSGRQVVAEGLGSTRTVDRELVRARGEWRDGRWRVVIARPLQVNTSEPVAQLAPGGTASFGVAVWEGAAGERAGIKAFSVQWRELVLGA